MCQFFLQPFPRGNVPALPWPSRKDPAWAQGEAQVRQGEAMRGEAQGTSVPTHSQNEPLPGKMHFAKILSVEPQW